MKKLILLLLSIASGAVQAQLDTIQMVKPDSLRMDGLPLNLAYKSIENKSFQRGEVLEYSIEYGFINAGKAKIQVNPSLYNVNTRPCYRIDVYGHTTGALDFISSVRDNWGTYLDTAAIIPHISYRDVKEGGYTKREIVRFDHINHIAETKVFNEEINKFDEPTYHQMLAYESGIQDIVSGYFYLRTLDFSKMKEGDTIKVYAFFENKVYDFKTKLTQREELETALGIVNALVLVPIMPDNKLFSGPNSVKVWISDDDNKIPLKVKVELFIGSAEINIEKVSGLKGVTKFKSKKG